MSTYFASITLPFGAGSLRRKFFATKHFTPYYHIVSFNLYFFISNLFLMENRIFLYPADLITLTGKSYATCYRIYRNLLDCQGKDKKKKLTIREYCKLEDVSEDEIKKALKLT